MSPQAHREEDQAGIEAMESPGRRLRIARQAKGMTQTDVAGQMHLSASIIDALESDNHEGLPGPVFVRGYLRNYARLLGMDENEVIADFNGNTQGHTPNATPSLARNSKKEIRSSHIGVRLMTWIIILGLIALLLAWWQGRIDWPDMSTGAPAGDEESTQFEQTAEDGSLRLPQLEQGDFSAPEEVAPEQQPTQPPATETTEEPAETWVDASMESPTESLPMPEPVSAQPQAETVMETSGPEPQTRQAAARDNQAPLEPAEATTAVAAPSEALIGGETETPASPPADIKVADGQQQVVFEFLGACWVDVRDSTRKFKLFGEMRKGEKRLLGGTPPYSVILGNSPMVRVTVDGAPYDVEAHSRGNVARFSLDPEQMN